MSITRRYQRTHLTKTEALGVARETVARRTVDRLVSTCERSRSWLSRLVYRVRRWIRVQWARLRHRMRERRGN